MGVLDTFRLDGKVALVTGGSRGHGLQIAEALGEAGAAVAITARREEGLVKAVEHLTQRGITAMSVVCDISKNNQVEMLSPRTRATVTAPAAPKASLFRRTSFWNR